MRPTSPISPRAIRTLDSSSAVASRSAGSESVAAIAPQPGSSSGDPGLLPRRSRANSSENISHVTSDLRVQLADMERRAVMAEKHLRMLTDSTQYEISAAGAKDRLQNRLLDLQNSERLLRSEHDDLLVKYDQLSIDHKTLIPGFIEKVNENASLHVEINQIESRLNDAMTANAKLGAANTALTDTNLELGERVKGRVLSDALDNMDVNILKATISQKDEVIQSLRQLNADLLKKLTARDAPGHSASAS